MADTGTSTNINFTKVETTISEMTSAGASFTGSVKKASDDPTIKDLQSAGLESGFASSYDERFAKLAESLTSIASELTTVIKAYYEADGADDSGKDKSDDGSPKYSGGGNYGGGGGGSSGGTSGGDNGSNSGGDNNNNNNNNNDDDNNDDKEDHDKVYNNQIKLYEKMSMEGMEGLAAELVKTAASLGITVDELLSNSKYATKLHSILLKSSYLSDELKAEINSSSGAVTQEVLRDIFNGKHPSIVGLNNDTASIYLAYLQSIATTNNISVEDLVTDEKYKDILKQTLTDFSKIPEMFEGVTGEELVNRALDIYDGKNISNYDENAVTIVRTYMDVKAEDLGKDAHDFNKNDAKLFEDLSKFGSMSAVLAGSSTEAIQSALINIAEAKDSNKSSGSSSSSSSSSSSKSTNKNGIDSNVQKELDEEEANNKKNEKTDSETNTKKESNDSSTTRSVTSEVTNSEQQTNTPVEQTSEQQSNTSVSEPVTGPGEDIFGSDGTYESTSQVENEDVYNSDGSLYDGSNSVESNTTNSEFTEVIDDTPTDSNIISETEFEEILDDIAATEGA